jgi:hypothetical protein
MRNLPKLNFMLGDFNMVEDGIDRLPHHADGTTVANAMRELNVSYIWKMAGAAPSQTSKPTHSCKNQPNLSPESTEFTCPGKCYATP